MDDRRFDSLARTLAAPKTRRGLLGSFAALGAGLLGARASRQADAQVSQVQCGNRMCASNPGICNDGCVCCVYPNGNSRCRPPGTCGPGVAACPAETVPCADGSCASATDPTACGCARERCPVNEACIAGSCSCRGDASVAPFTCCPEETGSERACASPGESGFFDTVACSVVFGCPEGSFPCVGVEGDPSDPYDTCQTCCPLGTICDPLGFCRQ